MLAESPAVLAGDLHVLLLVGVDRRLLGLPGIKCQDAGLPHFAVRDQRLGSPDVDAAPNAAGVSPREPDGVSPIVEASADAVDPAVAQGRVDGFGPGDALRARIFLM